MVSAVAHDFELDLLIALDALLHQHLMDRRQVECVGTDLTQFVGSIGKTTAGAAQSKCRTQNHRVTDLISSSQCLVQRVGDLGGNNRLTDALAQLLEELTVLGFLNALGGGTQQLGLALLQNALFLQLHGQVQSSLTADAGIMASGRS